MKKLLVGIFTLLLSFITTAQNPVITPDSEISILTIGPGNSLNDSFGHSAFRIKTAHVDIVYNYGIFDFDTPNFYTKFAQGKLNYLLGVSYYREFERSYKRQNRTIREQVLNLSQTEKQDLYDFLINNAKPENSAYLYDFFYDNCATRMRDVCETVLDDNINFITPKSYKKETFRELIRANLEWNSWGSFGIDVALGSVIDQENKPYEYMFLPEYVYEFFENATLVNSNEKLVKATKVIYKKRGVNPPSSFLVSPFFIFSLLGIFIIIITFIDYKKQQQSRFLDGVLFLVTGSIGVFLLLLWFATDHTATAQNYNLLWAFPLNLFVLAQAFKKTPKKWFISYLKFLVILLCLMTLHWVIGVQRFAPVLIPFLIGLLVRLVYLISFYRNQATGLK